MSALPALGPALPPALDNFIKRSAVTGPPLPLVKLDVQVPARPVLLDHGGAFTLTVYAGPAMQFSAAPKLGNLVSAVA